MPLSWEVDFRAVFSEFFSTGLFLYAAIGTGALSESYVLTALVFGFAVAVFVYASQHTNGGQLNPAVSVALGVSGYISYVQALLNVIAQLLAGVCAAALLRLTIPHDDKDNNLAANAVQEHYTVGNAVAGEIVCTCALQFVIFETILNPESKAGQFGPLAVGLVVVLAHVIANKWDDFWVFVVGPLVGALLAIPPHLIFLSDWGQTSKKDRTAVPSTVSLATP